MTNPTYKPTHSVSTSQNNHKSSHTHTRSSSHSLSLPATKLFRSRSKSPTPINTRRSTLDSQSQSYTSSPTQMSPTELSYAKRGSDPSSHSNSYSSSHSRSSSGSHPQPHRRSSDDYRRFNGTVYHYGRHSNDWLFGGFSVRDTLRDGVDKLRSHTSDRA